MADVEDRKEIRVEMAVEGCAQSWSRAIVVMVEIEKVKRSKGWKKEKGGSEAKQTAMRRFVLVLGAGESCASHSSGGVL